MFHHNDEMFRRKKALTEIGKRFSRMWLETNVWWNQKAHVCENQSELDSFHKNSDCKNIPHIYYLLRAMIMLMNAYDSFSVPSWFIRQQWLATSQFVVMQLSTEAFAMCIPNFRIDNEPLKFLWPSEKWCGIISKAKCENHIKKEIRCIADGDR